MRKTLQKSYIKDCNEIKPRTHIWAAVSMMAGRVRITPDQLDRLLDPDDERVSLATLQRAPTAFGRKLLLDLV